MEITIPFHDLFRFGISVFLVKGLWRSDCLARINVVTAGSIFLQESYVVGPGGNTGEIYFIGRSDSG